METLAKLDDAAETGPAQAGAPPADPEEAQAFEAAPWLREARLLLHADPRRLPGEGRRLLGLVGRLDRALPPVSIAWCGLFIAHCLRKGGVAEHFPLNQVQARPWRAFGRPCEPQMGAILVFWRFAPWAPFGHAGFYWGEDEEAFHVLGGNQHDRITVGRCEKRRLIAARWPEGAPETGLRRRRPPEAALPPGEKSFGGKAGS